MSLLQILEELPRLTPEERSQVAERVFELQGDWIEGDDTLNVGDQYLVASRLAEHDGSPDSAVSWEDARARLRTRFPGMSFHVILRPAAETDLAEAAAWYENQQPGLGREFIEAAERAIDSISANPRLVSRRHRRRDIRWAYPARFPFRIIYEIAQGSVLILAVLHAARDDSHLARRLRDPG